MKYHKEVIIHLFKNHDCWLSTTKEALNSHQTLSFRERVGSGDETMTQAKLHLGGKCTSLINFIHWNYVLRPIMWPKSHWHLTEEKDEVNSSYSIVALAKYYQLYHILPYITMYLNSMKTGTGRLEEFSLRRLTVFDIYLGAWSVENHLGLG